jgi:hypothetical protein
LQVYDELELGGLDDRQIGGPCTIEDAADVNADQSIRFGVAWSVTQQAAGLRVLAPLVECWKLIVVGERHNLLAPAEQEWIRADDSLLDQYRPTPKA